MSAEYQLLDEYWKALKLIWAINKTFWVLHSFYHLSSRGNYMGWVLIRNQSINFFTFEMWLNILGYMVHSVVTGFTFS